MDLNFFKRSIPFILIGFIVIGALVTGLLYTTGAFAGLLNDGVAEFGVKEAVGEYSISNFNLAAMGMSKYDNFPVFIADSSSWQNVLQLSSLATFSKGDLEECPSLVPFETSDPSVCAYPFLIIHDGDTRPMEVFLGQYFNFLRINEKHTKSRSIKSIKLYVSNEDDLSFNPSPKKKNVDKSKLKQLSTVAKNLKGADGVGYNYDIFPEKVFVDAKSNYEGYFSFWEGGLELFTDYDVNNAEYKDKFGTVIISEEDYSVGIYASFVASLLRVPLLFEESDIDLIKQLKNNDIIIVGDVSENLIGEKFTKGTLLYGNNPNRLVKLTVEKKDGSFSSRSLKLSPISELSADVFAKLQKFVGDDISLGSMPNGGKKYLVYNSDDILDDRCIVSNLYDDEFLLGELNGVVTETKTFCKDSLVASYLSFSRKRIPLDINNQLDYFGKVSSVSPFNKLFTENAFYFSSLAILSKEFNLDGLSRVKKISIHENDIITFVGAPPNMPYYHLSVASVLEPLFSSDDAINTNIVLGHMFGLNPADTAAMGARSLFINWMSARDKPLVETVSMAFDDNILNNFALMIGEDSVFGNHYEVSSEVVDGYNFVEIIPNKKGEFGIGAKIYVDLQFPFDKDYLYPESLAELSDLVKDLESSGVTSVIVKAHTDCRGTYDYNDDLATRRARHITNELNQRSSKISAEGVGEGELIPRPVTNDLTNFFLDKESDNSLLNSDLCKSLTGGCFDIPFGCIDTLPTYGLKELAHRFNRRVEVEIIGFKKPSTNEPGSAFSFVKKSSTHVNYQNDDVHFYFGPDRKGYYAAYDNEFYKGKTNTGFAPIHVFDVDEVLNFCFGDECSFDGLPLPLGIRLIRDNGLAVISLDGHSSVTPGKYFPDILTAYSEKGPVLLGNLPLLLFNAYAENHPPFGTLRKYLGVSDLSGVSLNPDVSLSLANRLRLLGDPLTVVIPQSFSKPVEKFQIVHVQQPNAYGAFFKESIDDAAFLTVFGESILDYNLLTKRLSYDVDSAAGSFDVYVLSESKPLGGSVNVYDQQYFRFDPDNSIIASDVSFSCVEVTDFSDANILKALKNSISNTKMFKCSFTNIFSNIQTFYKKATSNEGLAFIHPDKHWSVEGGVGDVGLNLIESAPYKDLVLLFTISGSNNYVRQASSNIRLYQNEVYLDPINVYNNDDNALINFDKSNGLFVDTTKSLSFSIDTTVLNNYYYLEGDDYKKISETGGLDIENIDKLIVALTVSGPFLKSCQKSKIFELDFSSPNEVFDLDELIDFDCDPADIDCDLSNYLPVNDVYAELVSFSFYLKVETLGGIYTIQPTKSKFNVNKIGCYCDRLSYVTDVIGGCTPATIHPVHELLVPLSLVTFKDPIKLSSNPTVKELFNKK